MHQNDLTIDLVPERDLVVALGQFQSRDDVRTNVEIIRKFAVSSSAHADLLLLPEAAMYDWQADPATIRRVAIEHAAYFEEALAAIAEEAQLTIIAGMYSPVAGADERPANRQVAYGPSGEHVGHYDKVHLYDAFAHRESDTVQPGPVNGDFSELGVIDVAGWKVGLFNCYDLRFPEITRGLIDRGADVLALSSAWVRGDHKMEHWNTLLRARAIENTAFVVAANQGGAYSTGHSAGIDPFGRTLLELGVEDELGTVRLDRNELSDCRDILPSLANRRYTTVGTPRD